MRRAAIEVILFARFIISSFQKICSGDSGDALGYNVAKSNFLKDLILWNVLLRCAGNWSGRIAVTKTIPWSLMIFHSFCFSFMMKSTRADDVDRNKWKAERG